MAGVLIFEALRNAGMNLRMSVDDSGWTTARSAAEHSQEKMLRSFHNSGVIRKVHSVLVEARTSNTAHAQPGAMKFLEERNRYGLTL